MFRGTIRRSLLKENWKDSSLNLMTSLGLLSSIRRSLLKENWKSVGLSTWSCISQSSSIRRSLLKENWKVAYLPYLCSRLGYLWSIRRSLLKENWKNNPFRGYTWCSQYTPIRRSLLKENWKRIFHILAPYWVFSFNQKISIKRELKVI